jgi:hypothetical protein
MKWLHIAALLLASLPAQAGVVMINSYRVFDSGAPGSGSITLTWQPVIRDSDNTHTPDIASYTTKCGTTRGAYTVTQTTAVGSLSTTTAWLGNTTYTYTTGALASGTWYCVISSIDTSGNESNDSLEISKVVP